MVDEPVRSEEGADGTFRVTEGQQDSVDSGGRSRAGGSTDGDEGGKDVLAGQVDEVFEPHQAIETRVGDQEGADASSGATDSQQDLAGSGEPSRDDGSTDGDEDGKYILAGKLDEVVGRLHAIETRVDDVLEEFKNRLSYDESKERQLNLLHQELQEYKSDLVGKAVLPLVREVIDFHCDLGRLVPALREKTEDELPREKIFERLEMLQEDVELLLEHHDVEAYRAEPRKPFDPKRQRVLGDMVPTHDSMLDGTVAKCVRPGFQRDEKIVEKARVSVYRLEARARAGDSSKTAGDAPERAEVAGGERSTAAGEPDQED